MGNIKFTKISKPKILLIPYPALGHVTPMLNLASILLARGFQPVLVTPEFIHRLIVSGRDPNDGVWCMSIPDGPAKEAAARDFFGIEKAMEDTMPFHLERLVYEMVDDKDRGSRVVCMVVDLLASWAIEVANRYRIPVAGFWPAMLATYRLIAGIPDMVRGGIISDSGCPKHLGSTTVSLHDNQPLLCAEELPWLIGNLTARKARFNFWKRTLDRSKTLPWLLVNSFPDETSGDCNDKQEHFSHYNHHQSQLVFPVGPLIKQATATKNPSFWEEDRSCVEWLGKQKPESVVYISFGSWVSPIGEAKLKNLALALEASSRPFIWVLAQAWRDELPNGFLERVSEQGKVVSWAPQMEILQHSAVGCYLTHCGWNSTMEAVECQKRSLCFPVAGDQFMNCAYIVKVWKIGVQINNGFAKEEIEEGVRKVMEDDGGEMKKSLMKLRGKMTGEEASSRVTENLTEFLDSIMKQTGT